MITLIGELWNYAKRICNHNKQGAGVNLNAKLISFELVFFYFVDSKFSEVIFWFVCSGGSVATQ